MLRRLLVSLIPVVAIFVGCSSQSTNADGAGGAGGGAAGSAGCHLGPSGADCFDCCASADTGGFAEFMALLEPRVCQDNVCDVDCKPGVCVSAGDPSLSLACKSCLRGEQPDDMAPQCSGSPACNVWLTCYRNCEGK
jgi:hypothetical protein